MNLSKDKYITNLCFTQDEVAKVRILLGAPKTIKNWADELGADISLCVGSLAEKIGRRR